MEWLQVLVLALVQGVTEFLPVSSSAHLVLPAQLTSWPDQGLAFDVAVHFADADFIPGHYLYADEDGIILAAEKLV